jgi:hypothetical protein
MARYYVSQAILQGRKQDAVSVARVAAVEIEQRVYEAVRAVLSISEGQSSIGSQSDQRNTNRPVAPAGFPALPKAESPRATVVFGAAEQCAGGSRMTGRVSALNVRLT